jgi:hypothetical protein
MQKAKKRPKWEDEAISEILDIINGLINARFDSVQSLLETWQLTGEQIALLAPPETPETPENQVIDPDALDF